MLVLAFMIQLLGHMLDPINLAGGIVIGVMSKTRALALLVGAGFGGALLILVEVLRAEEQRGPRLYAEEWISLPATILAAMLVAWIAFEVRRLIARRRDAS